MQRVVGRHHGEEGEELLGAQEVLPGEGDEEGAGDFDGLRRWWWLSVRVHHAGRLGHGEHALLDEGAEVGGEVVHRDEKLGLS